MASFCGYFTCHPATFVQQLELGWQQVVLSTWMKSNERHASMQGKLQNRQLLEKRMRYLMKWAASRKPTYKASKSKMDELVESMERFRKKHSDFHSLLLDGAERQASEEYFEDVEEKYLHIMDKIKKLQTISGKKTCVY